MKTKGFKTIVKSQNYFQVTAEVVDEGINQCNRYCYCPDCTQGPYDKVPVEIIK